MPFPAVLADELAALMVGKCRDDLVFTDLRGGVLRNSNWRARVFEPAVDEVPGRRRRVPDDHAARSAAHRGEAGGQSPGANVKAVQRMLGHAKASMTLDVYADLFDEDLDDVARPSGRGDPSYCGPTADARRESANRPGRSDLLKSGGAKGNRTPDLLDANESRYQLRHSP